MKHEGHHTIFFAFQFDGMIYRFARDTADGTTIRPCDENYGYTGEEYTKAEYTSWLQEQYKLDFAALSF